MRSLYVKGVFLCALIAVCVGCAKESGVLANVDSVTLYTAPLPPFSTPVTRDELRSAYYRYSAPAIVAKLAEGNGENWTMIMDKIAEGDSDWITHAVIYIAPGTDAASHTSLLVALAFGLEKNPEAVLAQEVGGLGLSMLNICAMPFIEPTPEFVMRYGKETLAALGRVDKPYLLDSKDACMQRMQKVLQRSGTTVYATESEFQ